MADETVAPPLQVLTTRPVSETAVDLDYTGNVPEYQARTKEDFKELEAQFHAQPRAFNNYVAPPAPGFDVHGLWHAFGTHHRTGYAAHATSLHWMLSDILGIPTQLVPHRSVDIDIDRFQKDRDDMLLAWTKEAVGYPHALFCSFPPDTVAEMDGTARRLVPYCAFEGDRVSDYIRDISLGPIFAKIWVVSDFVKRAFLAAGVPESHVFVMRPMLTDGPWQMSPLAALEENKKRPVTWDDPFVFGALGTWQKRKGMHDLIRAYFGTFKRTDPVRLHLKTSSFGDGLSLRKFKEKLSEEIAVIAKECGDDGFPQSKQMPRLMLDLGTELTDQGVIDLLGTFDCYVNASYGEGLGIPHVWAKAQGVPVVSTGFGAVGDLIAEINSGLDTAIEWKMANVDPDILRASIMFARETKWGVYDPADLGAAMRGQLEHGRRVDSIGAVTVRRLFGAGACVETLKRGLEDLLGDEVGQLDNKNTPTGKTAFR